MRIAWLVCLVPSIAIASPRPELSLQGGLDSVADPVARATEQGWDMEAEAGVRVVPRLSLLAFAGYARGPDYSAVAADTLQVTVTDAHRLFHEYGAKFRVHLDHVQPLFFGAGIGLQQVDVAWTLVMPYAHSSMAVDNQISGVMVDVETGVEAWHLPYCHCSMYVVAAYVRGADIDASGGRCAYPEFGCGPPAVQSLRLSVGMTLW